MTRTYGPRVGCERIRGPPDSFADPSGRVADVIGTRVESLDASARARWFNFGMKVAIVVAFAVAIFVPIDRLDGKGMGFRAPLFVGSAALIPLMQRFRRTPRNPYPHLGDGLLVAPFLLDTLGNLLGFYNDYDVTDDVLHFTNWVLLVSAFQAFRYRRTDRNDEAALKAVAGFYSSGLANLKTLVEGK